MKTKSVIITSIVVLLLSIGFTLSYKSSSTVVYKNGEPVVGATPSIDGVDSPHYRIGGVGAIWQQSSLYASSSVFCSLKIVATSTLDSFTLGARNNTLGAQVFDLSTSTTQYGSSSPAFISSGVLGSISTNLVWGGTATTTNTKLIGLTPGPTGTLGNSGASDNIIYPGQFINARIATTTPGTFATYQQGNCAFGLKEVF